VPADHPKVQELRALSLWSEGQVWISPERHGSITGVFKNQIDWLPLEDGSVRPTQGRTLAVMQVSGGSQSFNAVNTLRLLGRWMRMITIPNQSSVPMAYKEFDEAGRMKPGPLYDRVDYLLDLHSMTDRCPPLAMAGLQKKGVELARALGSPEHVIVDGGHAAGKRLRDYAFFDDPDDPRAALLIECGQHWERAAPAVALQASLRFLR